MGKNGLAGHLSAFRDSRKLLISQIAMMGENRSGEKPDNALFYTLKDIRVKSVLITKRGEGSPRGNKAHNSCFIAWLLCHDAFLGKIHAPTCPFLHKSPAAPPAGTWSPRKEKGQMGGGNCFLPPGKEAALSLADRKGTLSTLPKPSNHPLPFLLLLPVFSLVSFEQN